MTYIERNMAKTQHQNAMCFYFLFQHIHDILMAFFIMDEKLDN